jgi:hypothetical protein
MPRYGAFLFLLAERGALTISSLIRSISYIYKAVFCLVHRLVLRKVIMLFFAKERCCFCKDSKSLPFQSILMQFFSFQCKSENISFLTIGNAIFTHYFYKT